MQKAIVVFIGLASAVVAVESSATAQLKSPSKNKSAAKRITIDNLVTAAPLPEDYEIPRQDIMEDSTNFPARPSAVTRQDENRR